MAAQQAPRGLLRNPNRPPPPQLFQLPSKNGSDLSLPNIQRTATANSVRRHPALAQARAGDSSNNLSSPLTRTAQRQQEQFKQSEGDKTDALWAEMQATLAEVELSAARGNRFFGVEHSAALEGLRNAQISLAQAWARSEADEIVGQNAALDSDSEKSPGASVHEGKSEPGRALEEETEGDMLNARKRREANDRYYERVKNGVMDVVGKLDDVAVAMAKVEEESRDIWSEIDSVITGTVSTVE